MYKMNQIFKKGNLKPSKNIFSKGNGQQQSSLLSKGGCMSLHSALKNTYDTKENQAKFGKDCGYEYDAGLSNDNQQVYYNKDKNHMMFSVAGTHNANDIGTDLKMMVSKGGVKSTDRYREARNTLNKAKAKYNPSSTTAVAHSLGGTIISNLDGIDKKITYNKAHTNPFTKTPGNETHIRSYGDAVSFLSRGNKHTHNIAGGDITDPKTWLKSHNTDNLKKYNYKVPGT